MNGPNTDRERSLYDDGHSGCRQRGTGKPNVAARFWAWHRSISMLNRMSG